jgi:DNA-binding transcriptional ArsR family regulator
MQTSQFTEVERLDLLKISQFFSSLADETRIRILQLLSEGEKTVNEIKDYIGTTLPAISYQLKILLLHDLVRYEKRGRNKYYFIADKHIFHILQDTLQHVLHQQEDGKCEGKTTCTP